MLQMLQRPGNRHFLWRLMEATGMFKSLSHHDPHMMAINSGRRDVGLWLLNEILQADPLAYPLMQQEADERERRRS